MQAAGYGLGPLCAVGSGVFPHSLTTHVGSRQERLPEEVALRLHLTMMNEKHFKSGESSWRAEDTHSKRLKQIRSEEHWLLTPALENRGGEHPSDPEETGGSGGPLNHFAVVEENELGTERRHTRRLVWSVICRLPASCYSAYVVSQAAGIL